VIERERVFDSAEVSISRVNGRPRAVGGKHKRLIAYTAADVSVAETVRLLRGAAERLARSLPRAAE
jgi:hypothetical protein